MAEIRLENVTKRYIEEKRPHYAVREISLSVEQGEFIFLIGSSGAGKSTLLQLIGSEIYPDEGVVYLNDVNIARLIGPWRTRATRSFGIVNQQCQLIRKRTIGDNLLLCYPDEGAAKRYSELLDVEYIFCIKHRDWRTGKIERLELTTPEKVAGRNVLIVDDICSRGGTFTHTARALKNAGAEDIYLYVSHCENTIFDGLVLTDGLICHVFTTDSIYRGEHENITIINGGRE